MSDLLTPDEVREWLNGPLGQINTLVSTAHLCRDYLTLWDRNKELEATLIREEFRGLRKDPEGRISP